MDSALKNECIPYAEPGKVLTGHCSAAITGKRFVQIAADKQDASYGLSATADGGNYVIKTAVANSLVVIGVSKRDGKEGEKITWYGKDFIVPVTAGEAINAGELVGVGAEGKAIKAVASSKAEIEEGKPPYKTPPCGLCMADAESGKDAMIRVGA